jgi:hypothetical protein
MKTSTHEITARVGSECVNIEVEMAGRTEELLVKAKAISQEIKRRVDRILHQSDDSSAPGSA